MSMQFIREYTGKVDELMKVKIERLNEAKTKEQEKEVVAQHVCIVTQSTQCMFLATQC